MTPAVDALRSARVAHRLLEYECGAVEHGFGVEIAHKLGLPVDLVYKTLVAETTSGKLVLGLVPVAGRLNLKRLAKAVGDKNAELADRAAAERATGYVRGGITALGTKKPLRTVLEETALLHDVIVVSGGRRGLSIELAPDALVSATGAIVADILDPA